MHGEVIGDAAVDRVQESTELLGVVTRGDAADHEVGRDIERGVEVGGAVPPVVVRLDAAGCRAAAAAPGRGAIRART